MYEVIKHFALRLLKVPSEPDDPMGNVDSLLVFHASYNFFRYRFYWWMLKTVGGLFSLILVGGVIAWEFSSAAEKRISPEHNGIIMILIVAAALLYFSVQTVVSYLWLRLDYELRWYKVSDRSLRIREGVVSVREMTMTFANIQNIEIVQGPIQRLFRIADLRVESAGGGGFVPRPNGQSRESGGFHVAYFRGIDNAEEIRDLMRRRLEKYRNRNQAEKQNRLRALPEQLLKDIHQEAVLLRAAAGKLDGKAFSATITRQGGK